MRATYVAEKMKHTFDDRLHSFCKSWYLWNKRTEDNWPEFLHSCDLFILFNGGNCNQIHGQIYCYNFLTIERNF